MPRRVRVAEGGFVFHVINRAAKKARLFESYADYNSLEEILAQAKARTSIRLLAYCIMPTHWHLVIQPANGKELSQFMQWFTGTHAQRWQAFRQSAGAGAVYQGRYKAIPIQVDQHFLNVCRYVERNPLRAGLVTSAEQWPWSSFARRIHNAADSILDEWPVGRPGNWTSIVNVGESEDELRMIRTAVRRGMPLGEPEWTRSAAEALGLEATLRGRGRPKKAPDPFKS